MSIEPGAGSCQLSSINYQLLSKKAYEKFGNKSRRAKRPAKNLSEARSAELFFAVQRAVAFVQIFHQPWFFWFFLHQGKKNSYKLQAVSYERLAASCKLHAASLEAMSYEPGRKSNKEQGIMNDEFELWIRSYELWASV